MFLGTIRRLDDTLGAIPQGAPLQLPKTPQSRSFTLAGISAHLKTACTCHAYTGTCHKHVIIRTHTHTHPTLRTDSCRPFYANEAEISTNQRSSFRVSHWLEFFGMFENSMHIYTFKFSVEYLENGDSYDVGLNGGHIGNCLCAFE